MISTSSLLSPTSLNVSISDRKLLNKLLIFRTVLYDTHTLNSTLLKQYSITCFKIFCIPLQLYFTHWYCDTDKGIDILCTCHGKNIQGYFYWLLISKGIWGIWHNNLLEISGWASYISLQQEMFWKLCVQMGSCIRVWA